MTMWETLEQRFLKPIWWRFNGLKWRARQAKVAWGLIDGTAYYLSRLHGNDENSGLSRAEAFATYDRAQGALDYHKDDVIIDCDKNWWGRMLGGRR